MSLELAPGARRVLEAAHYSFIQTLGRGEYGVVVLAVKDHQKIAVKVTTLFKSFQAEVAILTHLQDHPNVIPYHGCWSKKTIHCIDFDYIPGHTMLDLLMVSPFSETQAHSFFRQLISGISHAHERGIAHRDLKAENVMISSDGRLFIIDWGMSFFWHPAEALSQTCGSPDYAAPEVYQKASYIGPELDIWALGVTLYAMVTSAFPFSGNTPLEIAYRICKGLYAEPTGSDELRDLIAKMLTVSRADRIDLQGIQQHPWFRGAAKMLTISVGLSQSAHALHKSDFKEDIYQPPLESPQEAPLKDKQPDPKGCSHPRKKKRKHRREKRSTVIVPQADLVGQLHPEPTAASTSDPIPESSPTPRRILALQRSSSWHEEENSPRFPSRSMLGWWKSRRNLLPKVDRASKLF